MSTPTTHESRLLPTLVVALTLGLAPWALWLLHQLAQFGQTPPDTLPWMVVALVGSMLAAPVAAAANHLPTRDTWNLALSGTLLAATSVVLAALPLAYIAAAPITLATLAILLLLPQARAELTSAAMVYIGCTVLANFTLDSFIPLGGFFLVNVGTFFFGVTFTQRDRIHRFGRAVVYRVIVVAAVANVVAALAIGTPIRYVLVSFLAILVSESADTEVYQRLLHRRWLARVAGSNAVSAPLDTVIFTVLAFAGAPFATLAWMTQVIVTDVLVKYSASMVAAFTILSRPAWVPKPPDA